MKSTAMKEDLVLEPITDYGISKAAATQFCFKEAVFNKLPVYTVRPFAVYGDYEMPGRLIPSVLVNALQNKPVTLSSPHFVRDFIYIDDMVDIYIAITKQMPQNHFIFNAGTGVQSSIQDVINTLSPMCDKPIITQWNMREPRPWEPKCWKADHTLAQQVLNWHPHYNLAKGLKKSLTWFKNHLELYVEGTTYHAHTTQQQQAL
jgi:nucleoside-diphosphate-sugar epimerase